MKRLLPIICLAVLALTACDETVVDTTYDIIPAPKEVQLNDGNAFVLTPETKVYYEAGNADMQRNAEFLSTYVKDMLGYGLQVEEGNPNVSDGIVLALNPADFEETEAYQIEVTPKQVMVSGSDAAGIFYGVQALRKSLPVVNVVVGNSEVNIALPCATIKDYPRSITVACTLTQHVISSRWIR